MTEINLSFPNIDSRLFLEDLTIISMEILGNICVEKLILSKGDINIINTINAVVHIKSGHLVFPCLQKCIKHLDVSHNRISGTFFKPELFLIAFMENLEFVDLSGQYLFQRRYDYSFSTAFSTYADTQPLPDIIFLMPKKLKHFNLGGGIYRIGQLLNITFENAHNLRYLNFSLNGLYGFNVTLKGLQNLKTLDLSGNDVSVIIETFFDTFPNVTHLRLADCFLDNDFILTHGRRLFQPLKKLEQLDLSRNNLIKLPKDIFKSLNQLKIINLAFNKLFSHPDYLNTPNLHILYLNFNNFISFSSQEIQMFNKLEQMRKDKGNLKLYIYGNSLACTCETYSFISWITFTTIELDRKNYTCIDQKGDLIFTADFKNLNYIQLCLSSVVLNISVFLAAAILVIMFTVFVVVKNKLAVKIFIQRLLGKFVYPKRRQDFKFDAYIIYPESLYQLVCFDMVENVEKQFALKFYIPHRDQLFGLCKEEDITESCKNSWKLVLILTQEFMDEPLAYFTLSSCLTSITLTTPNRLILIMDSKLNILPNIEFFLGSVSESNVLYTDLDQPLPHELWAILGENINRDDQN
ncbi:hypothetical protein LOTGIDRAFT_160709 [Lottia gigantea]|uniref:TIR domain-containing protein n=1 Tax=Lottia gigantea TaxID=225164 RepID=V4AJR5_LOTGI|nr:hypothetical protein LOTGIDRAFT_160709 [Lottia gigantea]ESO94955.1 hypothetical protein LOTGIDRAFT_160709 [Lottia gigantea]